MSIVSVKDLLHAGVHFGHQQRFWNPKMDQYIFDTRKKISIINLDLTQEHLSAAASKVEDICSKGNKVLFVGTKRSASKTIKEEASNIGLPYIDKRWLGGTLTNWKTIRGSIRRLHDINKSGWWILLTITIVGIIPLTYFYCIKGDDGVNDYGQPN